MRFTVVLHTDARDVSHYDLFFEKETDLFTLKSPRYPLPENEWIEIEKSFSHRKLYLEFEGELSKNRGSVKRVDAGIYTVLDDKAYRVTADKLNGIIRFELSEGRIKYETAGEDNEKK